MKKFIVLIIMVGAAWQMLNRPEPSVTLGPGVMAPGVPKQNNGRSSINTSIGNYEIKGVATFDLTAKVLAKKNYRSGREADLSPTDLALGWGNMSDESILEKIQISQSGRFYRWRVESFPIPRREIETYSANMHLIPANDSAKKSIKRIRQGDIIRLSGDLVKVKSKTDSWRWNTSKTRNDTGAGACELILVQSIEVVNP